MWLSKLLLFKLLAKCCTYHFNECHTSSAQKTFILFTHGLWSLTLTRGSIKPLVMFSNVTWVVATAVTWVHRNCSVVFLHILVHSRQKERKNITQHPFKKSCLRWPLIKESFMFITTQRNKVITTLRYLTAVQQWWQRVCQSFISSDNTTLSQHIHSPPLALLHSSAVQATRGDKVYLMYLILPISNTMSPSTERKVIAKSISIHLSSICNYLSFAGLAVSQSRLTLGECQGTPVSWSDCQLPNKIIYQFESLVRAETIDPKCLHFKVWEWTTQQSTAFVQNSFKGYIVFVLVWILLLPSNITSTVNTCNQIHITVALLFILW